MKHRLISELIATFCLVFAGCGAIVVDGMSGDLGHVGISLTFGLVVMAMIYSVGNVSGAHLNPAVTLGFWMARRLPGVFVAPYIAVQFLGAVSAALLLRLILPGAADYGTTQPTEGWMQAGLLEFVLTFILMFVILNVSTGHKEKGIMAGVAVGGTIALEALMGGPISGASMNPARSLGPALASWDLAPLWIYFVFPVSGALAAAPFCRLVQGDECCTPEFTPEEPPNE